MKGKNVRLRLGKSIMVLVMVVSLLIPFNMAQAATSGMSWPTSTTSVFTTATGGVWYPRMLQVSSNNLLVSFDSTADGGFTKVKLSKSTDGGGTWGTPITAASDVNGDVGNGQMLLLTNGDIWLTYRLVIHSGSTYTSYLKVRKSSDGGSTWSDLVNGQIATESETAYKGVWEPFLGYVGSTISVVYADDSSAVVGTSGMQKLLMKTWNGNGWNSATVVSDGVAVGSRDGMPVFTKMADGRYIMVFEATDVSGHPFGIKYKISSNGVDWSGTRQTMFIPTKSGKKAGAPFVVKLGDGRLMASFQTDDDSTNTGDNYSSMRTMISSDNGSNWNYLYNVFPVSDTTFSNWNALMVVDTTRVMAVTSANFPSTGIYLRTGNAGTPSNVNLVNNWGFETANVNGWTTYGTDYPDRIHIHGLNDGINRTAGGGNYFIGLSGTSSPGTAYIGQTITGLDSGTYTMRAYIRSSGGQTSNFMEVKDYGGSTLQTSFPVTGNWTQVTISGISVTNAQATIGFYAANTSTSQWADIDNVEFFKTASTTPLNVNLTNNWGFETANVNGWTTYGSDYPDRIHIHGINDGIARAPGGGNYFIGLAGISSPSTAYIGQTITGLQNGTYTMRAYLRSSGGQSSNYMEIKDYGGITQQTNFPVTSTWTQVTISGINVTNGQATMGFYAANTSTSQWADIDNVEYIRTN